MLVVSSRHAEVSRGFSMFVYIERQLYEKLSSGTSEANQFFIYFVDFQFLCVAPWDIMRWVVVGVAGVMSAGFLAINIRTHIKTASERWFLIVTSSAAIQLGLALVLKLYFFTYFYHDSIVHV